MSNECRIYMNAVYVFCMVGRIRCCGLLSILLLVSFEKMNQMCYRHFVMVHQLLKQNHQTGLSNCLLILFDLSVHSSSVSLTPTTSLTVRLTFSLVRLG